MSLFNKLFGKLLGKQEESNIPQDMTAMSYHHATDGSHRNRISTAENNLKTWLPEHLAKNGQLSFSWESGNDEGFLTIDNVPAEDSKFGYLEEYLMEKLDIPCAGEFDMNGTGILYKDGNSVKAKYCSVLKEVVDYDEETDEVVYGEHEEKDSGDKELFTN